MVWPADISSESDRELSFRSSLRPFRLARLNWDRIQVRLKGDFVEQSFLELKIRGLHSTLGEQGKTEVAVLILVRNLLKRCRFEQAEALINKYLEQHGFSSVLSAELENIRIVRQGHSQL